MTKAIEDYVNNHFGEVITGNREIQSELAGVEYAEIWRDLSEVIDLNDDELITKFLTNANSQLYKSNWAKQCLETIGTRLGKDGADRINELCKFLPCRHWDWLQFVKPQSFREWIQYRQAKAAESGKKESFGGEFGAMLMHNCPDLWTMCADDEAFSVNIAIGAAMTSNFAITSEYEYAVAKTIRSHLIGWARGRYLNADSNKRSLETNGLRLVCLRCGRICTSKPGFTLHTNKVNGHRWEYGYIPFHVSNPGTVFEDAIRRWELNK